MKGTQEAKGQARQLAPEPSHAESETSMTQPETENQPGTNATRKAPKDNRSLTWAAVLYPESLPENWQDILRELMVPAFISPLHDRDVNATGEPKKPHYHLLLKFATKKSYSQVSGLLEPLNGAAPQRINDFRSYARYLCHLDNPEKAAYDRELVVSLCGLDYAETVGTSADRLVGIREMMDWCNEFNVFSFSELCDFAAVNRSDWFRLLCDNSAHIMTAYLKSRLWSAETDKLEQLRAYDAALAKAQTRLDDLEYRAETLQAELAHAGGDPADALARRDDPDPDEVMRDQLHQFYQDCIDLNDDPF